MTPQFDQLQSLPTLCTGTLVMVTDEVAALDAVSWILLLERMSHAGMLS
jgi:hypothetical protein